MENRLLSTSIEQIFQKQSSKIISHLLNFSFKYRHRLCISSPRKHQKRKRMIDYFINLKW